MTPDEIVDHPRFELGLKWVTLAALGCGAVACAGGALAIVVAILFEVLS